MLGKMKKQESRGLGKSRVGGCGLIEWVVRIGPIEMVTWVRTSG